MKTLLEKKEFEDIINESPAVLIYFYNDTCAPCLALRPKVEEMTETKFPEMQMFYVNSIQSPDLSASNNVFASPTIVVYFDGKETLRVSKFVSISELEQKIVRYYNLMFI